MFKRNFQNEYELIMNDTYNLIKNIIEIKDFSNTPFWQQENSLQGTFFCAAAAVGGGGDTQGYLLKYDD